MPQCRLCLKRFHAWPEFMGHISQQACPFLVLQDVAPHGNQEASKVSQQFFAQGAPAPEELPTPTAPEEASSSEQPELAKQGDILKLSQQVRQSCSMQHCPECYQWVAKPTYLARHAVQSHSRVRDLQSAVKEWLKNRSRLQRPCEFWYQARPKAHLQSCPVLRISLHLMARHHNLFPGQTRLPYGHANGSATAGGPRGAGSVLSASHSHPCHDSPLFRRGDGDGPRQGQARVGTVQDGSSGGEQRRQAADGPDGQGPILHSGPESRPAGGGGDEPEGLPGTGSGSSELARPGPQPTKPGPRAYRQVGATKRGGAPGETKIRDRDAETATATRTSRTWVKQMGRLVLRLEDAQTIASLDTQFIMFIGTVSDHKGWSLTDNLYRVATEWNRKKEQSPESLTQPLRVVLLHAFLEVLYHKIEAMEEDQDLARRSGPARESQGAGPGSGSGHCPSLPLSSMRQSAEKACARNDGTAQPSGVVKMLQNLTACPNVIGRFHALHELAPPARCGGHSVQFANPESECRISADVHGLPAIGPQRGHAAVPHHPPPDPHGSQPPVGSSRQDAPIHVSLDKAVVCQLTLSNPSNYCYANSITNSVVWVASQCSQGIEVYHLTLSRLLRWLLDARTRVADSDQEMGESRPPALRAPRRGVHPRTRRLLASPA